MKYKAVSTAEYLAFWKTTTGDLSSLVRFWESWAEKLKWHEKWRSPFDGRRWFAGGKLNASVNVLDKHRGTFVWEKAGLIFETEEGDVHVYTYSQLHMLTEKVAAKLRALRVGPGDYVLIYAPPLPETLAVAWAAARVGAPFEWVFTGWGFWFLSLRIRAVRPKVIITTDAFPRRGRPVAVKANVDKAVEASGIETKVALIPRMGIDVEKKPWDVHFFDVSDTGEGGPVFVEADHPLFALPATEAEGSEGTVVHETGGYLTQTYATTLWIGLRPRDTYFCTVLPGWITGITYVLFGPFMVGSTVVVYEGGPDYPHWDRWWSILERYAVTVFLTTPGALRLLSRSSKVEEYNLDMLRLVLTTAEPMEEELWWWTYKNATGQSFVYDYDPKSGGGRVPVIHFYITREVGTFLAGNLPNLAFAPIKPGTSGLPFPGFAIDSLDNGASVRNKPGRLVLKMPWPGMPLESHRWVGGVFYLGDIGIIDDDMYIRVLGRDDEVLKVNGYRISPGDIRKALEAVGIKAEVYGRSDPLKFQVPVVKAGSPPEEVKKVVRSYVGPIADPEVVQ